MKHILLSIFLLLSGSVRGQEHRETPPVRDFHYWLNSHWAFASNPDNIIREIVRAEIERWWEERFSNVPNLDLATQPEPLKMVIDTVWEFKYRGYFMYPIVKHIDTLYRLSKEQVEKLR